MRSFRAEQSPGSTPNSNNTDDSDFYSLGQSDDLSYDVMCLVYPDGRTTTVVTQSTPD